jgi:Gas vesicle synthesis protein GvpL/GvpF
MQLASHLVSSGGGKYLYAVTLDAQDRVYDVAGIDRQPVYNVSNGRVAAVVSDFSNGKIRPERSHLAAHKEVLARLMADSTALPMAFGIIANDLKAVKRMLALNEDDFVEQLQRVAGKVEMGLRVVWQTPNIFEYFVDHHPDLRARRDELLGGNREARQEEKMELGRFFEQVLNEDREAHFNKIEETLSPCCAAIKRSPPRQVQEVVKLSLLVERDRQKELDEAILAAARLFDDNYAFDVNGPWAPHNFVEMNLELGDSKSVQRHAVH